MTNSQHGFSLTITGLEELCRSLMKPVSVLIIDGYIDDPAALGVPPYISPIVRATAGAAIDAGAEVMYFTIDHIRHRVVVPESEVTIIIHGNSVPGRYLRSMPASDKEIIDLISSRAGYIVSSGHTVDSVFSQRVDLFVESDVPAAVYDLLTGKGKKGRRKTLDEWNRWMLLGASIVTKHQDYPQPLIVEIETFRGCHRYLNGGCSYCVEPMKGKPLHRHPQMILDEAQELIKRGVRNIRVGGQTCIMSYGTESDVEVPKPNPSTVRTLFEGLKGLSFDIIHVDNANPAVISTYPDESRQILEILRDCCTSGNVLALGMESADPHVVEMNNLNAYPNQVMDAIRLINEVGSEHGENGMPHLLPGINIIAGLEGETAKTYDMNLEFLRKVRDEGLMLRRINIRQVMPVRREFDVKVDAKRFKRFKEQVRTEIDQEMLKRVVPYGTVLRNVYTELHDGVITFGRQIGSYPLLVGIPYKLELERFYDIIVTGWGFRSITALEYPFPINTANMSAISSLPGIGKKRAATIVRYRPYKDMDSLASVLDDSNVSDKLRPFLRF